jgi:predicted DNA-binding transcriptional regulator YafY
MAKKRAGTRPTTSETAERASITPERFARLHLLLTLLAKAQQTREVLARKLKLDVRGFYRDLEMLRQAGIVAELEKGCYHLRGTLDDALNLLPFPDALLTLGEMRQLARGRTSAHQRLQAIIQHRLS